MIRLFSLAILALSIAACAENAPPEILDVTRLENTTDATGPYGVYATVVDDRSVKIVELRYRVDNEPEVILTMTNDTGNVYYDEIPGQAAGSRIFYFVAASDGEQSNDKIPTVPPLDEQPYYFDIFPPADTE